MGLSRSAIHLPYPLLCCMQIGYACSLEINFAAASNAAWWAQQMETDTFGMCDSAKSCQEASRTSDFLEAVFRIEGADMWALSVEERVSALRDQALASNDFIDACDLQAMAIQEAAMASPPPRGRPPAIQEAASASPPPPAALSPCRCRRLPLHKRLCWRLHQRLGTSSFQSSGGKMVPGVWHGRQPIATHWGRGPPHGS
jgi:hypothetical protein